MEKVQQIKSKLKSGPPPPPRPKPAHLIQSSATSSSSSTKESKPRSSKRGLGWPWDQPSTHFPLYATPQSHASWLFNWELWVPPSLPPSIEWVPCVRTAVQCADIIPFLTDISTNQKRVITHLLGFNEPEIADQANLEVEEAARLWEEYILPAKAKFGFRLGSPGMSSDVGRSVPWLHEFLARLGGVDNGAEIDFLVLHWYGPDFGEMKWFLETMYERFRLPVWLNEFACSKMGDGEVKGEEVLKFMGEALPWLEATDWVERYAYYGHGQGQDVGTWVGRASNFTIEAAGCGETGGRKLSEVGRLYLEL